MTIGDAPNSVDSATSDLETGIGAWESWYSADVAQTTEQTQKGTKSLKVSVTDPWGWAVQLSNFPGFDANPGAKRISYYARQGSGNISNLTLRVKWMDSSQNVIQSDSVPLSLSGSWQHATSDVTAPAGTVSAYVDVSSSSGTSTDSLYLDNVVIYNK
jgi:hypothetical protein